MTACATCARAVQPAWKFCIYCGAKVERPDVAVEPVPHPAPQPESASKLSFVLDAPILPPLSLSPEPAASATTPAAPPSGPRIGPLARVLEMTATRARRARAALADDDVEEPRARRSRPLPTPVLIPESTGPILAAPFEQPGEPDLSIHHLELPELTFPEHEAPDTELSTWSAPTTVLTGLESTPEPAPHEVPDVHGDLDAWEDEDWDEDDRTGAINTLAIIALAMGVLASPLAALFGHLAVSQLKVSGERGVTPAWIAIVLGYLWLGAWIVFGISYLMSNG